MILDINKQQFNVPLDVVAKIYSKYYILHWSGEYLLKKLVEPQIDFFRGTKEIINHQEVRYEVFLNRDLSYWKLCCQPKAQFALSFRLPKDLEVGMVLVKQLKETK